MNPVAENSRCHKPAEHVDVPRGDDYFACSHCKTTVEWSLAKMTDGKLAEEDPGQVIPAQCPHCWQHYVLTYHDNDPSTTESEHMTQAHETTTDSGAGETGEQLVDQAITTEATAGVIEAAPLTGQQAFETEIAPLLQILAAKCEQHNISSMVLIGFQLEGVSEGGEIAQELLMNVTPYQSQMVPAPINSCIALLQQMMGAGAPN